MKHNIVFFVFLGFGLLFSGLAYYLAFDSRKAKATWESHTATVVELEKRANSDKDGYLYAPVFEYNVEGQLLSKRHETASNPPAYNVGDRVGILVNPRKPELMKVDSFWGLYLWSTVFGVIGAVFGMIGAFGLFFKKPL